MQCCANRPDTWMHSTGGYCRQKPLAPQGPTTASGHTSRYMKAAAFTEIDAEETDPILSLSNKVF